MNSMTVAAYMNWPDAFSNVRITPLGAMMQGCYFLEFERSISSSGLYFSSSVRRYVTGLEKGTKDAFRSTGENDVEREVRVGRCME